MSTASDKKKKFFDESVGLALLLLTGNDCRDASWLFRHRFGVSQIAVVVRAGKKKCQNSIDRMIDLGYIGIDLNETYFLTEDGLAWASKLTAKT